jgi:hypothetical protein
MSVAGLLDAMRACGPTDKRRPTSYRLVWMCLENHANGHRVWRMTERDIAAELQIGINTVSRAIHGLIADGIVEVDRFKRRPSVFRMLKSYAKPNGKGPHSHGDLTPQNGPSTQDLNTQNGGSTTPPRKYLTPQIDPSTTELTPQNGGTKTPPVRIHQKGKNTPTPHAAPVGDGKPPPCVSQPAGFADFWAGYPRKVGKRAAATAFAAAVKRGTHPDDILDGLDRARPKMELLDERYRPHPKTWLNQDRWHDEPDTVDPVLRALGLVPDDMATGLFAGLRLQ